MRTVKVFMQVNLRLRCRRRPVVHLLTNDHVRAKLAVDGRHNCVETGIGIVYDPQHGSDKTLREVGGFFCSFALTLLR